MPDAQIHPTGTVSTPADYVVPDSAELLLKGVYAEFDGSGAAGSYRPLVRFISDAGSTVIEAVSDTTIAAGASADASWFPHLAAAAPSTSGGSVAYAHGYDDTPQVLLSGGSLEPGFATVSTTDSAVLAWSTSVLTNDTLTLADGHVAIVWASCAINGGQSSKDAFIYAISPTDQLGHDGVIGLSFNGFSVPPGPQGGQPNFEDQTLVLASGGAAPIQYRMTSTDVNDRAVHRIYMAALAFAV